ncbi:hypothetical protein GOODEAATRI_017103 [Goodea atripinnis]|uniref:Uncharacterized protein n=1 Tax=Goodea atripinnis TaxID=208336 RepID=A0ABV0MSS9_9TELE
MFPADRQIRHRACALKDTVHAIIREELDEDFEKICEEIKESRKTRGCSTARFAPSFYHVLPKAPRSAADASINDVITQSEAVESTVAAATNTMLSAGTTPKNTGMLN